MPNLAKKSLILILAVLSSSVFGQASGKSTVVPLRRVEGMWLVEATVGGKKGTFYLDVDVDGGSGVLEGWLGKRAPVVSLGGLELGRIPLARRWKRPVEIAGQPIARILDGRLLHRFALGFDPEASTLTLWPSLGADEAARWVGEGEVRLPLRTVEGGFPVVEASLGGKTLLLGLTGFSDELVLRSDFDPKAGTPLADLAFNGTAVRQRAFEGLRAGPWEPAWVRSVAASETVADLWPDAVEGALPVGAMFQNRFVVDVPGSALVGCPKSSDARLSREMSHFLRVPARVEGGRMLLGKVDPKGPYAPIADYVGRRIVLVEDRYDVQLLPALRGKARMETVAWLAALRQKSFEICIFETEGGTKVLPVQISPAKKG